MSVASANAFAILAEEASPPGSPGPATQKKEASASQPARAATKPKGPASRGGRYYPRGGKPRDAQDGQEEAAAGDERAAKKGKCLAPILLTMCHDTIWPQRTARVVVVEEEGVVVIAVEGVGVHLTGIVRQARLTLTRRFTRAGEAMRVVMNLRPRKVGRLMPMLRVLPPLRIVGILCLLILGVNPHRQILGGFRLLKMTPHQLLRAKRVTTIANQGIETLKKKITLSPTINTSLS